MGFAKAFLFFLNTVFLGLSGLLIYVAVWLIKSYKDYFKLTTDTYTVIPAGIIIAVGCFILITAITGCCGTCRESKCCLTTFFVLLFIVLSLEIAAGVLGGVYKKQAKGDLKKGLDEAIKHYNHTDYGLDKTLDFLQEKLKCCGDTKPQDFKTSPYWEMHHNYPPSCYPGDKIPSNKKKHRIAPYEDGCYEKVLSYMDDYLTYIIGIGIGFAVLQLFGMIAACFIMCKSSEVSYSTLNGGTFV